MNGWQAFGYEVTGLKGQGRRLLTDLPADDAAVPQGQLPKVITDAVCADDGVTVNLTVRVHPVGDPDTIAYVRYDQLALYDDLL